MHSYAWISISDSIHKTNQTGHTNFGSSSFGASDLDSVFEVLIKVVAMGNT